MKRIALLLLLAVALVAPAAYAQTAVDDVEITRSDIQADRKALVAANMELTETEGAAFWPVYNAYRQEMNKVTGRAVKVIMDYAAAYNDDSLTDEQAGALIKEYLGAKQDKAKLAASYQKKFEKVLPGKKVARFYQIENRLDLIVEMAAAVEIPLVK